MKGHGRAVALALLLAALATAGCGLGRGAGVGEVSLTVSRDFGARRLQAPLREAVSEADTVMRVLDRNARISTRYGGRFVQSIDGVEGAQRDGARFDCLFYVNGVESPVGAADFSLRGEEAIWWDYRDWSAAVSVPAVVGSWPQPFADGYEGEPHPVAVQCEGERDVCAEVGRRLGGAGADLEQRAGRDAIRVLVGPWARLRRDPTAAQLERGPQVSGVFGKFVGDAGSYRLIGIDESGGPGRRFGADAGLVAATRRNEAPPVWLVTGATPAGVRAAAGLLDAARLRDHYAVATEAGADTPLPVPSP